MEEQNRKPLFFSENAAHSARRALNRIQSKIYDRAFSSNENVLVCAPTGAGKTNIAMLAVLHEIGANMADGVIQVPAPSSSQCNFASTHTSMEYLMSRVCRSLLPIMLVLCLELP